MIEKTLGLYLKELRKSYHYTQEFVASHLDVSRQAYSHYETGRAVPSNDTCCRIANLYSIPVDSIIRLSLPAEGMGAPPSEREADLAGFLQYIEDERNLYKLKYLSRREKELLYYFDGIPVPEQDEVLEILKIKMKRFAKKT